MGLNMIFCLYYQKYTVLCIYIQFVRMSVTPDGCMQITNQWTEEEVLTRLCPGTSHESVFYLGSRLFSGQ